MGGWREFAAGAGDPPELAALSGVPHLGRRTQRSACSHGEPRGGRYGPGWPRQPLSRPATQPPSDNGRGPSRSAGLSLSTGRIALRATDGADGRDRRTGANGRAAGRWITRRGFGQSVAASVISLAAAHVDTLMAGLPIRSGVRSRSAIEIVRAFESNLRTKVLPEGSDSFPATRRKSKLVHAF